jgi:hypothetical protein
MLILGTAAEDVSSIWACTSQVDVRFFAVPSCIRFPTAGKPELAACAAQVLVRASRSRPTPGDDLTAVR